MAKRNKPTVIIDADVLCHQFAYKNTASINWGGEGDEAVTVVQPEVALMQTEGFIMDIRKQVKGGDVVLALSDRGSNFRKELDPTYKATRLPKPELWEIIRTFIEQGETGFPTVSYPRLEGDDTIGILHTGMLKGKSVMVSIDKDMKTIPGKLFNPQKPELGVVPISEEDAYRFHLFQTITGDTTDEYKGCPGIGEKGALRYLSKDLPMKELWKAVVIAYESKGFSEEHALAQARLAFILRDGYYNLQTKKVTLWKPQ